MAVASPLWCPKSQEFLFLFSVFGGIFRDQLLKIEQLPFDRWQVGGLWKADDIEVRCGILQAQQEGLGDVIKARFISSINRVRTSMRTPRPTEACRDFGHAEEFLCVGIFEVRKIWI